MDKSGSALSYRRHTCSTSGIAASEMHKVWPIVRPSEGGENQS